MSTPASIEQALQAGLPDVPPDVVARVADVVRRFLEHAPGANDGIVRTDPPAALVSEAVLAMGEGNQLGDVQIGAVVRGVYNNFLINLALPAAPPALAPKSAPRPAPPARVPQLAEIAGDGALGAFAIGRRPVSQAEYALFVADNYRRRPERAGWQGALPAAGAEGRPVVGVSWCDARAYCAWLAEHTGRAYRLPTEAEWRCAAAGPAVAPGAIYEWTSTVWGDEFAAEAACVEAGGHPDEQPAGRDVVCCGGPGWSGAGGRPERAGFAPTTKERLIGFRVAAEPAPRARTGETP